MNKPPRKSHLYLSIEASLNSAAKNRHREMAEVLKTALAAIRGEEAEARARGESSLKDGEVMAVLKKLAEQSLQAAEQFKKAGREKLLQYERWIHKVISSFLPNPLSHEETMEAVCRLIREGSVRDERGVKLLMQKMREKYAGRVDMRLAGHIARSMVFPMR